MLQPLEEVTFARFSRLAAASAASAAPGGAPAGADEATLRELQLLLRGAVAARDDELTRYTSQQQSAAGRLPLLQALASSAWSSSPSGRRARGSSLHNIPLTV